MGITLHLKQISVSTLDSLKQDPKQVELFRAAKWLSEPSTNQFVTEWEIPDLDLHKYSPELTYLLAGYIPDSSEGHRALPELQSRPDLMHKNAFMKFFIIENSEWDGLPLVNAIWAGTQIGRDGLYWYQTPEEVGRILDGLLWISEEGFQARYRREAESEEPCPWFDWDEEEMLDWLTNYYNAMVHYYQDALRRGSAILANLSI